MHDDRDDIFINMTFEVSEYYSVVMEFTGEHNNVCLSLSFQVVRRTTTEKSVPLSVRLKMTTYCVTDWEKGLLGTRRSKVNFCMQQLLQPLYSFKW